MSTVFLFTSVSISLLVDF